MTKPLALLAVLVCLTSIFFGPPASATTPPVWGAVGDSITYGWGSGPDCVSFPGSGEACASSYPHQAGLTAQGYPGQCLVAQACWYDPLEYSFGVEVDALKAQGITSVVVEIGINDLSESVSDFSLEQGYALLRYIGTERGVNVVLSTITPFGPNHHATQAQQDQRQRINTWLRNSPYLFVNYAKALGGTTLLPAYDSGDGIHPSAAGHAAMAVALTTWTARRRT